MVPVFAAERVAIGLGGLVIVLFLESCWPFRPLVETRWYRSLINFVIMGSNALVLSVLLGGTIVGACQALELHRVGALQWWRVAPWWNVGLTVVMLDGVTYWWHRAYHGVPVMWRMHRVHHSDRDVDVTTSGRFHLTEMVLSAAFRLGVLTLWGPVVGGVVIFEIVFGLLNQVEHSNLQLPTRLEPWVRLVFVTPAMHRVHHSQIPEHTNSNYGTIFSWWDRLGRTYRMVDDQRALTLGLPEYPRSADVTFGKVLTMPFGPSCQEARALRSSGPRLSPLS